MAAPRRFLGRDTDLSSRRSVYLGDGFVEVEESTLSEIERRRVYFEDVLALTYHRYRGIGFLIFTGLFGGLFLLSGLGVLGTEAGLAGGLPLLLIASVLLVPFLLRLILGVDVITVYGRRTMARMQFWIRKGRAAEIFDDLQRKIGSRQAALAAAAAPPPPPAPEGIAPPPPL